MQAVAQSTDLKNQNIRVSVVGSNDTKRVSKRSRQKQEQSLDINPHKSTKKAKAKERQEGRKTIKKELTEQQK